VATAVPEVRAQLRAAAAGVSASLTRAGSGAAPKGGIEA
jgi:hypothetical protein